MTFKNILIGKEFHTGKLPSSYPYNIKEPEMFEVWKKIDLSHAKCIDQFGYGNRRSIGSINTFAPNKIVFVIN